ncbi:immunoglobulin superfamily member 6 [Corythoichthys intestinalis]|uniref:immunoglobulin superfamily member 6 n=1 Tax=Corythoichthys intestinalis TaxID=161448 RepID=UPI0025A66CFE|nr:immunoglobulin superfamily member 6 [Corythoichthys intestinalis]
MVPLFWLSFVSLTFLPLKGVTEPQSCLTQPSQPIWREPGQEAEIQCSVHSDCSAEGLHYRWFVFQRKTHGLLDLGPPNHHKYNLQGSTLQLMDLNPNDSGIYYCAATSPGKQTPGAQHVGMGTTLIVKEKMKFTVGHILLWLTFVVLAVYSLATVTLIVQKKYGFNICNCRWIYKSNKKSTDKRIFRNVLQEMHHKREVKRNKQTAGRNPMSVEVTTTALDNGPDDIYQNVH